ncbi:hypothetical protein A2Z23_02655 [Candidatus Curtissbacteria bacterium RBG_16_39_7]|uniref:Uncharacterized protein n=1 Tax=Candidatus Curtissbacteria bacterium RBG_16_39_7 TaxID=1797707 RepID=A0A1F5G1M7_9BACT|nr:MAG: hypothetical protein A2Z23_02655 [Candidatus Curtissbacteria bacterium RBG_16_39_7]
MTEFGEGEKPKKMSRRGFLVAAGALIAGGVGGVIAAKGEKVLDILKQPTRESIYPRMSEEITGEKRTFVLEEEKEKGKWPVLRKEPNQGIQIGLVKPGIEGHGVEVFGAMYQSWLAASKFEDPENPDKVYGKWVRTEEELPLWDNKHNPILDENGVQKRTRGYFSENFITFTDKKTE